MSKQAHRQEQKVAKSAKEGVRQMHPDFRKADSLSKEVIGAAIEVHKIMGPGLLESIYQRCLLREMELRGYSACGQEKVNITYKDVTFTETLRFDLLIENVLLVEVKAVQEIHAIHKAQLLSYMKLLNIPVGLLINFHEMKVVNGISRMILKGADTN